MTWLVFALSFLPGGARAQGTAVSASLQGLLAQAEPTEEQLVWVYFKDKGDAPARLAEARAALDERAIERRARRGSVRSLVSVADVAPAPEYVEAVRRRVKRLRHVSRWFNAVSAEADGSQIASLSTLPFVRLVDTVRRYRRGPTEMSVSANRPSKNPIDPAKQEPTRIDYGSSFGTLEQINVPAVHDMGFHGEGVLIAVFDTGFTNLGHEALARLDIRDRWDFVNRDRTVTNQEDRGDGGHGTKVLSVLGGRSEGNLVGPAYAASFILAKTEDTESETPIEEDNWTAAAEWAESLGADVISTSLGYLGFDEPFIGYTYEDMNGETAMITLAAQAAAERGVVVVTSAGNAGFDTEHNTLGAPADGKLVIAVGGVNPFDARVDFSSVGPTVDGRVKPDVMAQGVVVKTASPIEVGEYLFSNGTSFSCPLTAGVVALVLQAHPDWTVQQVIRAMRSTASNANTPNRLMGWGIVDAAAAVTFVQ